MMNAIGGINTTAPSAVWFFLFMVALIWCILAREIAKDRKAEREKELQRAMEQVAKQFKQPWRT